MSAGPDTGASEIRPPEPVGATVPRPGIEDTLARMQVAWITAVDGARLRTACFPARDAAPVRGHAILLPGRSEFIEKHAETAADLTARGFCVWSLDWRGQGRSDRALADRHRCHATDFAVPVRDLTAWITGTIEPAVAADAARAGAPMPVILLGHSMGGHLALRYLAEHPEHRIEAAVLSVPMVDVWSWALPILRPLAGLMVRLGQGEAFAPTQRPWSADRYRMDRLPLTHDPERFAVQRAWFLRHPELVVGGVTWGWLNAAQRSTRMLYRVAPRLTVPMLLVAAGKDRLVSNTAIAKITRLLPRAEMILYPDAYHEILMEHDPIRDRFLADLDRFLERVGI